MDKRKQLQELHEKYSKEHIPSNINEIVEETIGIRLASNYVDIPLANPLLIASGQLTLNLDQIKSARKSGFAGCVLKSVVGEAITGLCSMSMQRKMPTSIKSYYESEDAHREFPIIHWNGRCDARSLDEYMDFARGAKKKTNDARFVPIASILCHLPLPGDPLKADEWVHTTKRLFDAGYNHIEIDFCPFLKGDNYTDNQKNVLDWYRNCTALMKTVSNEIRVIPKMLNLEWGLDFQVKMAEAAIEGGADGLLVANRIFKSEYNSGHGGIELRERNLAQVKEIKKCFPSLKVAATGGVYNGRQAYEYLKAGAECVQLLSFIMGKVNKPFAKAEGNKFEKVFHKLLLDPNDGLVAAIIDEEMGVA